jgi:hypothetical protein
MVPRQNRLGLAERCAFRLKIERQVLIRGVDAYVPQPVGNRAEVDSGTQQVDRCAVANVSPQRKYQLRMKRDEWCVICGEPRVGLSFCLKHMVQNRERARRVIEATSRFKGARSYRLEQEMKLARRLHLKK